MFLQKLSDIPCHVWILLGCTIVPVGQSGEPNMFPETWKMDGFPEKGLSPNQPSLVWFVNHGFRVPSILKDPPFLWIIGIPPR